MKQGQQQQQGPGLRTHPEPEAHWQATCLLYISIKGILARTLRGDDPPDAWLLRGERLQGRQGDGEQPWGRSEQ